MFLELSEALACPHCGPPQGLIVLVDQLVERRVLEGRLDCPGCETRFPIEAGVVDFGQAPPDLPPISPEPDQAVLLAALLGLHEAGGYVLLGPGFANLAAALTELATGNEFLLLSPAFPASGDPDPRPSRLSVLCGTSASRLPLLPGRLAGAGLASASPELCLAAYAAVRPGANVAVLDPLPGTETVLEGAGGQVLASESRAIAVRRRH